MAVQICFTPARIQCYITVRILRPRKIEMAVQICFTPAKIQSHITVRALSAFRKDNTLVKVNQGTCTVPVVNVPSGTGRNVLIGSIGQIERKYR
jgi:hypothetical protein